MEEVNEGEEERKERREAEESKEERLKRKTQRGEVEKQNMYIRGMRRRRL